MLKGFSSYHIYLYSGLTCFSFRLKILDTNFFHFPHILRLTEKNFISELFVKKRTKILVNFLNTIYRCSIKKNYWFGSFELRNIFSIFNMFSSINFDRKSFRNKFRRSAIIWILFQYFNSFKWIWSYKLEHTWSERFNALFLLWFDYSINNRFI